MVDNDLIWYDIEKFSWGVKFVFAGSLNGGIE
jgi:hypothetical protein